MVTLYRDAMQTYALDGLKLDFIDEFYFGSDTAFPTDDMDIPVLEDAMFRLMCDIHDIVIDSLLEAPEYYSPEFTVSETGEVSYTGELEPNPDYIPEGSPKRAFYSFLMDFMPGGQALQIAGHTVDSTDKMCYYDIG